MRYSPEQSNETRQRVLDAAGREFRRFGFAGIGIDALAKAAGVTSGALYGHFKSKAQVFRAVAIAGVERSLASVGYFRSKLGEAWFEGFADYYLSAKHREDVTGGCALPTLSIDVAKSDPALRAEYAAKLLEVADAMAEGLPNPTDRTTAWPILAQLVGGVLLSRAVDDAKLSDEIAQAVREAAVAASLKGPDATSAMASSPG